MTHAWQHALTPAVVLVSRQPQRWLTLAQTLRDHGIAVARVSTPAAAVEGDDAPVILLHLEMTTDMVALASEFCRRGTLVIPLVSEDCPPSVEERLAREGIVGLLELPMHPRVMSARITALWRFKTQTSLNRRVTRPAHCEPSAGPAISLTPIEQALFACLQAHADRVAGFQTLFDFVWGAAPTPDSRRALRVHMSHLRRKLVATGRRVVSVRSHGYRLAMSRQGEPLDGELTTGKN